MNLRTHESNKAVVVALLVQASRTATFSLGRSQTTGEDAEAHYPNLTNTCNISDQALRLDRVIFSAVTS